MKLHRIILVIVGLFIASTVVLATNPMRNDLAVSRDSSLIPNNETDLTKIVISDDADHTIDMTPYGFFPLILLVRADGNFHDGSNAPVQANDLWRDGGQLWSIPVAGRQTWHFKRQSGAGTVNLYIKLLGSN